MSDKQIGFALGGTLYQEIHHHYGPTLPKPQHLRAQPGFVGRGDEVAQLEQALKRGHTVITSVQGMGGVGKTALANHVGLRMEADFPDGQILHDLQGADGVGESPLQTLTALVRCFAVLPDPPPPLAVLQQLWRSHTTNKKMLVVFDNAASAAQLEPLMPGPGPVVLVTSRQRLAMPGLQPIELGVLTPGDAVALACSIAQKLTAAEAEKLCQSLGYHALAIEVASGLLANSLKPVATWLKEFAASERLAPLARVQKALAVSIDALEPAAQQQFALLAAWPGAFDQDRAALLGCEVATLDQFRQRHLIEGEGPFILHDLLRDLGRARLAELPPELRWEIGVQLNAAFNQTISADGPGAALPMAMAKEALATGSDDDMQPLLGAALDHQGLCLMDLGDTKGARQKIEASLSIRRTLAARDPGNTELQCDLSISLETMGDLTWAAGDAEGAREAYEESLGIRRRLAARDPGNVEWQRDLSISLNKMGDLALAAGDAAAARAAYAESLEIRRQLAARGPANAEWQRDLSVSLNKMGDLARAAGDAAAARAAYAESLEIRRQLAARGPANAEWQRDLSVSLTKMGDLALAAGDAAAARAAYAEGLEICRQLAARDSANVQWAVDLAIAQAKLASVEPAQARAHLDAALALMRPLAAAGKLTADHQRSLTLMEQMRAALDQQP